MIQREQHIKTATLRRVGNNYALSGNTVRVGTNYTLSGSAIRGGRVIILSGETSFYPCGHERAPGIDSCSCGM